MLDWSYDLLQPDERCLLARLSTFVGGFTLAAAEQVCGTPPLSPSAVLDVLEALIDKSLVISDRNSETRRFRLLETVRIYAADRLNDADEVDQVRRHHAAWVRRLAIECLIERSAEDLPARELSRPRWTTPGSRTAGRSRNTTRTPRASSPRA